MKVFGKWLAALCALASFCVVVPSAHATTHAWSQDNSAYAPSWFIPADNITSDDSLAALPYAGDAEEWIGFPAFDDAIANDSRMQGNHCGYSGEPGATTLIGSANAGAPYYNTAYEWEAWITIYCEVDRTNHIAKYCTYGYDVKTTNYGGAPLYVPNTVTSLLSDPYCEEYPL